MKARIEVSVFLASLVLAVSPSAASASQYVWVEITRPMLSCWAMHEDDAELARADLRKVLPAWKPGKQLERGCAELKPGEVYPLDVTQPRDSVKLFGWCISCSPFMWPMFAPKPERVGGAYWKRVAKPADLNEGYDPP